MATLCLQEEEMLAEKLQSFPVLYGERVKGFKEKDAVQNAWEKVAESLDFAENGNFIQNILKIAVLRPNFLQNISKPIRFSQMLFWMLFWNSKQFFPIKIKF